MRRTWRVAAVALVGAGVGLASLVGSPAAATPPPGAEACPMFPADSYWHADVRSLPVHARSDAWLSAMGGTGRRLHPDFGPNGTPGEPPDYGIPYAVVGDAHGDAPVAFDYDDESDRVPYPFGPDIPIEGGEGSDGDRHALMLDRDGCRLYELFDARWNAGQPTAGSGAVYDLRSNALRPSGWTSADAAGLPILPGLLRRDEVVAGRVDHAIRMTASQTAGAFVWPARHQAGSGSADNRPPMGAWFRMKADYPTGNLHPYTQVIVEAFKTHGMIVADNGSNWYFSGAADAGWEERVLNELKALPAGAFEAVDQSSLMVDPNSGAVRGGGGGAPVPVPTTVVVPVPAPTTTARPRPTATTAAPTTTVPPTTTAPPETVPPETTTLPALPTTAPVLEAAADDEPDVPQRASRADEDTGPNLAVIAAALAVLVSLAAAGVVVLLLRRRRTEAPAPAAVPAEAEPEAELVS